MKFISMDRKSVAFRLTKLIVIIIMGQAAMLSLFLIFGGVISQAEQNAFTSFSKKVANRKEYLQREMKYYWTNMNPYIGQISEQYGDGEESEQFFDEICEPLIAMLRTTQTTGVFVILENSDNEKDALYIRDYDPILNDYDNKDLYLIYGPSGIANNLQIPLDQIWKSRMNLSTMDSDFYDKPISKAGLSSEASFLGYWSIPFRLSPDNISIITYTMPLFDKNNKLIGIIGVEISEQYLTKFLPATDLQNKDSYGYMLGYEQPDKEGIEAILLTKEIQKRITKVGDTLEYMGADQENSVFLLKNSYIKGKTYISIENLGLYRNNTPFQQHQWYLIGIMGENHLLNYVLKIKYILFESLIASVIIGIIFGYIESHKFTKPIIEVAKKVKGTNSAKVIELEDTGLTEVDDLLNAIQTTSNMLLETSGKMSNIIEMMGLPLGVFEYDDDKNNVFVTDRLSKLLSLDEKETEDVISNKNLFIAMIQELLSKPEDEEEDIYHAGHNPEKWLKIKFTKRDKITIGIVIDVTDDMSEKKKIMADRDIDPLTGIYNRKAMQMHMEDAILKRNINMISAIVMFDLDNLKTINDTYGHKWGDIYIKHVVKHLSAVCKNQVLGRRSGDEFSILIYNYDSKEQIRMCIDEFYQKLHNDKIIFPDGTAKHAAVSAGLVWIEQKAPHFDEYLQKADDLMYDAKRNNKGHFCETIN
ncbi:sensor domain-containing diguanylate cyclase [Sedimentibacter sp. B4]|uniref:sensor domain-containing diguanylate cyclase n=1 Tax=Sedimentibacter sp. B4 TaxID=304766 RepID=UPI0002E6241D|nr:diguanylate cyclase [Sedimentibacter sp. B4]